jgi:hypothetical protein
MLDSTKDRLVSPDCLPDLSIDRLAELVVDRLANLPDGQRSEAMVRLLAIVSTAVFAGNTMSLPGNARAIAARAKLPYAGSQTTRLERLRLPERPAGTGQIEGGAEGPIWRLQRIEQMLVSPAGARLRLSGREFILLETISDAPGQQVARGSVSRQFGYDELSPATRSLDSLIYRLRQKARAQALTLPLNNIHAVGIRFTEPLRTV